MKKTALLALLLFSLSLLAFGCASQGSSSEELVVGVGQDTVDPNGGMWESRGLVFETLVTLNDKGEPRPLLAKKWEVSPDGKNYTFFLQENVKFHDGTPFNAQALKENVEKLQVVWGKYPINKVEAVNDNTVCFLFKEPYPLFMWHIAQIAGGMVVSPKAIVEASAENSGGMDKMPSGMSEGQGEQKGSGQMPPAMGKSESGESMSQMPSAASGEQGESKEGMGQMPSGMGKMEGAGKEYTIKDPVGTGPYKLAEHKQGQYWVMEAVDDYWQGDVGIKRIKYSVIPDPHSRVMALESGQIHITGISPLSKIAVGDMVLIEKNEDLVLKHEPSFGVTPIAFNTAQGIFTDARVREAFVKSVNRDEINKVLNPCSAILTTPVAPASPFYVEGLKSNHKYDPAGAQELLAEAGWTKGTDGMLQKNGKPLEVSLIYIASNPEMEQIASILEEQLKGVGINLKVTQVEGGALFASLAKKDYELISSPGIGASSLDFKTDYHTKGRYSVGNDKELDQMIDQYNNAANTDEQKKMSKKIQEKILNDHLVLLYFNKNKSYAYTAKLQNLEPSLEEECNFLRHIWKAKLSK
ncbi:MAG: ABC transporter substrate-binding protein [Dethiobacteria bacterium]